MPHAVVVPCQGFRFVCDSNPDPLRFELSKMDCLGLAVVCVLAGGGDAA